MAEFQVVSTAIIMIRKSTLILVNCVSALSFSLSGCVTADTLDAAKARSHVNDKHEVIIDQPARPAFYALLPLSVAADTVLLPVYIPVTILVNTGVIPPP